ncbi:MAG: AsmA-like C-terminal region-containing protein, partial [Chitinophagales bacterium]
QYENFIAAGTINVSRMNYRSADYPLTTINNLLLTFNPQNVLLNQLDARMGKSDFKATGSIDNLLGYYFKKELLKGSFNLNSSLVDLNELMSSSSGPSDTAKLSVIEVPSDVDLTMTTSIGKVLYEKLIFQNISGKVWVHEQKVDLSGLSFNIINGNVVMSGTYSTILPGKPAFSYNLSLNNFDIQQTVKTFSTVQQFAPIAERSSGSFSSDLIVNGVMDAHMQPILNSLNGKGKLITQSVTLSNFEPLNKFAEALKMDQYKKLNLADLNLSFTFKDGRVIMSPFTARLAGTNATISGSSGLDQTIDFIVNLAIPKSTIPAPAIGTITSGIARANSLIGTDFQLPDPVKVNMLIGGTIPHPTIKTDFSSQGKTIIETMKEEVKQEVKQQGREQADKILADAQKQSQAIRDAAKASADKLKAEGYAAADKLVAQTTNPLAKIAAQEAAKKAKKETDKRVQEIIDEGNKKSQLVLDEAKKKSDELLK